MAESGEDVSDGQARAMKAGVSEPFEAEQNRCFPKTNRRGRKGVKNDGREEMSIRGGEYAEKRWMVWI